MTPISPSQRVILQALGAASNGRALYRNWSWDGRSIRALRVRGFIEQGLRETQITWWCGDSTRKSRPQFEYLYRITADGRTALAATQGRTP